MDTPDRTAQQHHDYDHAYYRKVHNRGRLSLLIALVGSFAIPFYLSVVLGHGVDTTTLTAGMIFVLGFVGIIWIVEPISYYPVLGPVGNYMSFLSGNIGNMRMPVVGGVQKALDAEPGTKRAELAAVYGLAASTITNLVILFVVIIGGTFIVRALPDSVLAAFTYAIPGIVGAMIYAFGSKLSPRNIVIVVVLGLLIVQAIRLLGQVSEGAGRLLGTGQVGIAAAVAIVVALLLARRESPAADPKVEEPVD